VSIHGKRYAISDGDRAGNPKIYDKIIESNLLGGEKKVTGQSWIE
jgi:hypothetical protein